MLPISLLGLLRQQLQNTPTRQTKCGMVSQRVQHCHPHRRHMLPSRPRQLRRPSPIHLTQNRTRPRIQIHIQVKLFPIFLISIYFSTLLITIKNLLTNNINQKCRTHSRDRTRYWEIKYHRYYVWNGRYREIRWSENRRTIHKYDVFCIEDSKQNKEKINYERDWNQQNVKGLDFIGTDWDIVSLPEDCAWDNSVHNVQ